MKKMLLTLVILSLSFTICEISAQNVLDGVYLKEHTPNRKAVPYPHLREADVMWNTRIWRKIDLREKINQPLYFPTQPIGGRMSLFDVILKGVESGALLTFNDMYDDFRVQLTKAEAVSVLVIPRILQQEDPDNPGNFFEVPDTLRIESKDVVEYRLKEDWFFDKQRSVLDVRVIGICPIINTYDESGAVRGQKALFWLYYPNCREVFANAETFNRQNDAERRTYEDIFWKRLFSSYIFKQSNVYDRQLSDYETGLDNLIEGNRIKEEIFTLEMDLWHY